MTDHESDTQPTATGTEASGDDTGQTLVQTGEGREASAELSLPHHVKQHDSAPTLPGYVLTEQIGKGAYGEVWRAWQLRTRKQVAVKVFLQRFGLDWIFLQRELERLTRLDRHPHIVTLLDTGLEAEPPYYVMDLIEGGALEAFVDPQSTAAPQAVLTWMDQICDALGYVHGKGLIHCDLKPANILLDLQSHVRVVDFGQSRVFTESAASMGTLFYMAPEQARLSEPGAPVQPDVRWDIYAFGASMYSILTGRVPFASPTNTELLQQASTLADRLQRYRNIIQRDAAPTWNGTGDTSAPPDLVAIVRKCMAPQPDERYPSTAAIAEDLRAMRANRPVSPLAGRPAYRVRKFLQRNPFKILLVLAMVGVGGLTAKSSVDRSRRAAASIMADFMHRPEHAADQFEQAHGRVRRYVRDNARSYLDSAAFTDRIMGARAGIWADPAAFWASVDGGKLWQHGEWLEVVRQPWPNPQPLIQQLETKITSGTVREKYVALCIAGQLAADMDIGESLRELFEKTMNSATDAGVISAAWWAARRAGRAARILGSDRMFVDTVSGLVFAKLPEAKSFRRGSPADEPNRWDDEDKPDRGVAIAPIYVATTEVTYAALAPFLGDEFYRAEEHQQAALEIRETLKQLPAENASRTAAGFVSLVAAKRYCGWLSERASGQQPGRQYRLLTEGEWEYACRGGNPGRFCFGDEADYAEYFAHCNGSVADFHTVAQRMPNAFGLFDMHGGVWEWTSSRYPPERIDGRRLARTTFYVIRGGAWYSPAVRCRSAQRNYYALNYTDERYGFRLVMVPEP